MNQQRCPSGPIGNKSISGRTSLSAPTLPTNLPEEIRNRLEPIEDPVSQDASVEDDVTRGQHQTRPHPVPWRATLRRGRLLPPFGAGRRSSSFQRAAFGP